MQDRFKFRVWDKKLKCMLFADADTNYFYMFEDNNFDVMQSTGLKDKNGKLIYEGDIINARNTYILQVSFKKDYACICFENDDLIGYLKELRLCSSDIEVIGNIYETPELLEVQND